MPLNARDIVSLAVYKSYAAGLQACMRSSLSCAMRTLLLWDKSMREAKDLAITVTDQSIRTARGLNFTPEIQFPSPTGLGTVPFNQQRPRGPWTPGRTQVNAAHWPSLLQAASQLRQEFSSKFL